MQSGVSCRILMIRATKKLFLIVKSVRHSYEVRVENKCPAIPVVLVALGRILGFLTKTISTFHLESPQSTDSADFGPPRRAHLTISSYHFTNLTQFWSIDFSGSTKLGLRSKFVGWRTHA